jgi:crotonobetainyl-CoA:carnitine CoA-transferase CaiB-like acyl-CoA transferase
MHPQVKANDTMIELDHPEAGRIRHTRTPARFSNAPPDAPTPAPRLGADTRDVLAQAGYDANAVAALIADGIATDVQDMPE